MDGALSLHFTKVFRGGPEITVDLDIPLTPPNVTVLFGPSGSGKTTLLRVLAGLDETSKGTIKVGSETWADAAASIFLAPQKRRIGFLFQEYALFPHLTIERNIGYGLRGLGSHDVRNRVCELMERFQLEGLEKRHPHQLSGGQKQRVALARTVAPRPRLLLLDEPLAALDAPTRETVRGELRGILHALSVPILLVTHDRLEAMALGDKIAVMGDGRVLQHGPVDEVFRQPVNQTVARIVGVETVVPGRVTCMQDGMASVAVGGARLSASVTDQIHDGSEVLVCVRAEDVILLKGEAMVQSSARNRLAGFIRFLTKEGPMLRITLDCGFPLAALLTRQSCEEMQLKEGDAIVALVKAPNVHLVPRQQ